MYKKQIIDIFADIKSESKSFKSNNEKNLHAVKAVIVYWIGFCLSDANHPYMDDFDIAEGIYPRHFQLTRLGEAVNVS